MKQIKISFLLFAGAIISCILHNAVYGLFGFEEPVFFSLTLLLFLAFVLSIGYNIFNFLQKRKSKSSRGQSAFGGKKSKKD